VIAAVVQHSQFEACALDSGWIGALACTIAACTITCLQGPAGTVKAHYLAVQPLGLRRRRRVGERGLGSIVTARFGAARFVDSTG